MPKRAINSLHIFAFASHGTGISGGDRIWIELTRRWRNSFPITVHTWDEGKEMARRQNLLKSRGLGFKVYEPGFFCSLGFVVCYFARIVMAVWVGLKIKLPNDEGVYIYNASEFWMDALPCVILKIRYPKLTWIASWYQTAPNPFRGYSEQKTTNNEKGSRENTYKLSALLYWLVQLPIKPLVKNYADKVIVNNEGEKKQFPSHTKQGNTIVLIGAVPLESIKKWQFKNGKSPKIYDAVFQGRFHPQKGVVELIAIWEKVVEKKSDAKLAIIGDGPLIESVKLKIKSANLENNVQLLGYVFDGPEKYSIFSQSKVVVHPAFFDSGGMASAEAMAFGIPCIGFDLPSYASYYPRGMVKVEQNNLDAFADAILDLLSNSSKLKKLGDEAYSMIEKKYSWDKRASDMLRELCN